MCHRRGLVRADQVNFWRDDLLYAYLRNLYDYFYGDRKEPPESPDDVPPPGYEA
ncbi:hypothetical protein [Streptomyces sp. NRRL S-1813]|uniref:hypothetical protein n=1 Tax=Streptomyces sp. NRRL S-1813 TaxID=1463888 RepID=UPI000A430AB7|nr:hypothetical protein [Streptomyces sp. NRRL S-1813]